MHTRCWCAFSFLPAMGCISSKVIARSLSLHEERNQGTQRTKSNSGIPLLEDIINSAHSSCDQYFELVLHSRSFGSNAPSKLATHDSSEATDKLDTSLSPEEDEQEGNKQKIVSDVQSDGRSKSCHLILPEHVLSSLAQENSSGVKKMYELANELWLSSAGFISKAERSELIEGNKYDLNSRSRSFHTVEEYDDLVRKLLLSKSLRFTDNNKDDTCSSGTTMDLLVSESVSSSTTNDHTEDKDSAIKDNNSSDIIQVNKTVVPSEKDDDMYIEKGNKRKAIAKRLESLRVPSRSNFEVPVIASLREWIHPLGSIYSPGSYVTPKFGSYSSLMAAGKKECESREDSSSIFSPELVSELEQSMQNLEAEEENILKQIMESPEENDGP